MLFDSNLKALHLGWLDLPLVIIDNCEKFCKLLANGILQTPIAMIISIMSTSIILFAMSSMSKFGSFFRFCSHFVVSMCSFFCLSFIEFLQLFALQILFHFVELECAATKISWQTFPFIDSIRIIWMNDIECCDQS